MARPTYESVLERRLGRPLDEILPEHRGKTPAEIAVALNTNERVIRQIVQRRGEGFAETYRPNR
jgi:hypothetical protein